MTDPSPILAALKLFCIPGQVVELRALNVGGHRAVCEVFNDPGAMARRAAVLDAAGAMGTYFTPNPLKPAAEWAGGGLKAPDVLCRHWLLIDCDPRHPAGTSCDDAEHTRARRLLDACREALESAGLRGAVVSDSGNGWHLCYPVDMPNDAAAQELIRDILRALDRRCGDPLTEEDKLRLKARQFLPEPKAGIGVECHDAPRIWKLPGTMARKGVATFDRPHRRAALIEGQPWDAETARHNTALLPRMLAALLETWSDLDRFGAGYQQPTAGPSREETYARKALQAECDAVAATVVGTGLNDRLSRSAFKVGRYVQPGLLTYEEAASELYLAALQAGANDPRKDKGTIARQLKAGALEPWDRNFSHPPQGPSTSEDPATRAPRVEFPPPIPASQLKEGPTAPALWKGLINRGAITLMCALWKAGKTTLLVHLIRAMERGGQFCGLDLTAGSVLYVTEESESRWARRRTQHSLRDHIDFLIRPFTVKPGWPQWHAFLSYLNELLAVKPRDLIILDTLTNLWPVKDENDASQVQAALMPLHGINPATGTMLVHHTRKGDGQEATASRGSGALTAFVDTILEFRRYSQTDRGDRRRVLTGYGRDEETPDELVIELTDGEGYVPQGRRVEVRSGDIAQEILPLLPTEAPGLTHDEIMGRWIGTKPQRQAFQQSLQQGADNGLWFRTGRGVRGDPFRYWTLVPANSVNGSPPL